MLRRKLLIVIIFVLTFAVGSIFVVSRVVLIKQYEEIEKHDVSRNLGWIKRTIENEIENLNILLVDWSAWDDTYEFVEDQNEEYIESNLIDETFTGSVLNLILYLDNKGELVYGKAYDLEEEEEIEIPEGLLEYMSGSEVLLQNSEEDDGVWGILMLNDPWIIAFQPILRSDDQGPVRGTMVMGKIFNEGVLEKLAGVTGLPLSMQIWDDAGVSKDFVKAKEAFAGEEEIYSEAIGRDVVAGFLRISDVFGEPVLMFETKLERVVYKQGIENINYNILIVSVIGILATMGMTLVFDKVGIRRVTNLIKDVGEIAESGEFEKRVRVKGVFGKDELFGLAENVNELLGVIEGYKKERDETEQMMVEQNRELQKMNDLMIGREGKIVDLKEEIKKLKQLKSK